jgi:hypothetical protein
MPSKNIETLVDKASTRPSAGAAATTGLFGSEARIIARSGSNAFCGGDAVTYTSGRNVPIFDDGHTVRTAGGFPSVMEDMRESSAGASAASAPGMANC